MNNFHILGTGAIGLTLAYKLSKVTDITLLTRSTHNQTYTFSKANTETTHQIKARSQRLSELPKQSIERIIVPVKAYQVAGAIQQIAPYLMPNAVVILSHNGLLEHDELTKHLPKGCHLLFLSTSMGAAKTSPTHVTYNGDGPSQIGRLNTGCEETLSRYHSFLEQLLFPLSLEQDIKAVLWKKLAVNVAINLLTAQYQVPNGILRQPAYALKVLSLLSETCEIAKYENVTLPLKEALKVSYSVMTGTAANRSSMAQDIFYGRKTEIDAIAGFLIKKAQQHNIAVPHLKLMFQTIKQLETA